MTVTEYKKINIIGRTLVEFKNTFSFLNILLSFLSLNILKRFSNPFRDRVSQLKLPFGIVFKYNTERSSLNQEKITMFQEYQPERMVWTLLNKYLTK